VYRALEGLMAAKLVHRVETLNAYLCCDHAPHSHDVAFAICDTCGSVREIPLQRVEPALKGSMAEQGFAVRETRIEVHGECEPCHTRIAG
jgi:Fur family zinc uptake transcriptional regulator